MKYEPRPGTRIDSAVEEAFKMAVEAREPVKFDFNGVQISVTAMLSRDENIIVARKSLGLPEKDPPLHPKTALDALARWDKGETVFTVEMGGLGPGYEQAIQMLVFEIIRDNGDKPLPEPKSEAAKHWGDPTVSRCDEQAGGDSGAMVGAAKSLAYRALRDGWEAMVKSAPANRHIQVSKDWPKPITP